MTYLDQIQAKNPMAFARETKRFFGTRAIKASQKTACVYVYNDYHGDISGRWCVYSVREDFSIGGLLGYIHGQHEKTSVIALDKLSATKY